MFSCDKIFKNIFFDRTTPLVLLRFNSCFQRSTEQKRVRLSAVNTKFSWRTPATLLERGSSIAKILRTPILKNICERLLLKISFSVTNLTKGGNFWFFYPFNPFGILNFAMTEWFCHVTCFAKVSCYCFFSLSNIFLS